MKKSKVTIYLYLFLFLVVAFVFYIDKDRKPEEKEEVKVTLDTSIYEKESKTIKKYENFIVPTRPSVDEESFLSSQIMFSNKKVTIADLKERDKMYTILSYLDKDGYFEDKTYYQIYDDEGNELDKQKKISEKKYNPQRGDMIVYKDINPNEIKKVANRIFNEDIEIPVHMIYNNSIECTFADKVECNLYQGCSIGSKDYVKYVSSDIKDDEIHIYQKFLHETSLNGVITLDNGLEEIDKDESSIKEITNGVLDKYGTTYKTTFKKSKDGKFYWYSSEPLEKAKSNTKNQ